MAFSPKDKNDDGDFPGMFIPEHDEVHICCVFTWDIERAKELQAQWQSKTDRPVLMDGPAFGNSNGNFVPGMYVKTGVAFTSRGCPNHCSFCFVPKREGKIRELPIVPGNIVQDNNFLACSKEHRQKIYDMLKGQHSIEFKGGLEAARLTDWDIEQMRGLKIHSLWLACDTKSKIDIVKRTCDRLHKAGFNQNKIYCYTLIGDDMKENLNRVMQVFMAGAMPFAQLFQPEKQIKYSEEWEHFARTWSRPAATKAEAKRLIAAG